jgi:hypothetical protein
VKNMGNWEIWEIIGSVCPKQVKGKRLRRFFDSLTSDIKKRCWE